MLKDTLKYARIKTQIRLSFPRLHLTGLTIGWVTEAGLAAHQSLGYADKPAKRRAGAHTQYCMGEAGMAVIATLFGMLQEDGLLTLHDPVRRHCPEFAMTDMASAEKLTIYDLLCHQSGLFSHAYHWMGRQIGRDEVLRFFASAEPQAPVGSRYLHCPFGYALLGLILEKITGCPLAQWADERLFRPLGMRRTRFGPPKEESAATGYLTMPDGTYPVYGTLPDGMLAACGLTSTAEDYSKLMALYLCQGRVNNVRLLGANTLRELTAASHPIGRRKGLHDRLTVHSACGWRSEMYRGEELMTCGGGADGYYTLTAYMPAQRVGLVLMSNSTGAGKLAPLAYSLLDRLLGWEKIDWPARFRQYINSLDQPQRALRRENQRRRRNPLPLPGSPAAYHGTYRHPCGISIKLMAEPSGEGVGFAAVLGGVTHRLEHISGLDFEWINAAPAEYGLRYPAHFFLHEDGGAAGLELCLDPELRHYTRFLKAE